MKKEFVFQIEQDDDMLVATCHEPEMATQGDNLDELLDMIRDLIRCRFDNGEERLGWPIRFQSSPLESRFLSSVDNSVFEFAPLAKAGHWIDRSI
jgi:predicted RNase H-like HicB family nuclease